jgi:Tfp pilus assembly protein PilO
MLSNIKNFVKDHRDDIILLIVIILISLLSFAVGFILAREKEKESIEIEHGEKNSLSRSYNYRW